MQKKAEPQTEETDEYEPKINIVVKSVSVAYQNWGKGRNTSWVFRRRQLKKPIYRWLACGRCEGPGIVVRLRKTVESHMHHHTWCGKQYLKNGYSEEVMKAMLVPYSLQWAKPFEFKSTREKLAYMSLCVPLIERIERGEIVLDPDA